MTRRSLVLFWLLFFYFSLQSTFVHADDASRSVDSLKKELSIHKDDTTGVNILLALSNGKLCTNPASVKAYLYQALAVSRQLDYKKGIAGSLNDLGMYYSNTRQHDSAFAAYISALPAAFAAADTSIIGSIYSHLAFHYEAVHDMANAIRHLTISREYYRHAVDDESLSSIEGNLGIFYANINDLPNALSHYQASLELMRNYKGEKDNGYYEQQMLIVLKIGDLYMAMNDNDKAERMYDSALAINVHSGVKNAFVDGLCYKSLADVYYEKKDYKHAIEFYEKSVQQNTDDLVYYSIAAYLSEAKAWHYLNDNAKAYERATQGLALSEKHKFADMMSPAYYSLGLAYAGMGNTSKAIACFDSSIAFAEQNKQEEDYKPDALEQLYFLYEKAGQPAKALTAYKRFIEMKEEIRRRQNANEVVRLELQYDFKTQHTADSVKTLKDKQLLQTKVERQRTVLLGGFIIVILLVGLSLAVYSNNKRQRRANKAIKTEKNKSDALLLNILPAEVAEELKEHGAVQARAFDEVTVLFTDFVNFTQAGEQLTPQELVNELHACFKAFDEILQRHHVEKIKTVGDAYLAVCGLPTALPDHAERAVRAAIEIRDFMTVRRAEMGSRTFEIRIGIHSGNIVAGIVGVKKFAYDIWGDTVNTAARMEQACEKGKINISQTTYELVKDKFTCVHRGALDAKNKGKLEMYFAEYEMDAASDSLKKQESSSAPLS